jgi:hypothetical protein
MDISYPPHTLLQIFSGYFTVTHMLVLTLIDATKTEDVK